MESQWLEAQVPFTPLVGKSTQGTVAFLLMAIAFILTGLFWLNKSIVLAPLLAIPASLAFGFGSVYLICSVGVYV
ncbi:hypothetical protein BDZ91DRAFT_708885 [Kalaharituber pfeilii]|nr:hypothetical protein BDZ91DRAFT_708885 [Kalaharituber pfeilii]